MTESKSDSKYRIEIIVRNGLGVVPDDYHATVTRCSDDATLFFIARWRWVLKRKLRRSALDRIFKSYDKRQRFLATTEELTR